MFETYSTHSISIPGHLGWYPQHAHYLQNAKLGIGEIYCTTTPINLFMVFNSVFPRDGFELVNQELKSRYSRRHEHRATVSMSTVNPSCTFSIW